MFTIDWHVAAGITATFITVLIAHSFALRARNLAREDQRPLDDAVKSMQVDIIALKGAVSELRDKVFSRGDV